MAALISSRRRLMAGALAFPFIRRADAATLRSAFRIGQSSALTGAQAPFGTQMRAGVQLLIAHTNAAGGVRGKPLEFISLDDAGDENKTRENTKALLNQGCDILVGYTTRPCCVAGAEMANKAQIPFVGPFSGTPALYRNDGTTFTVRASYDDELAAIVNHLAPLGYDDIAFVYLNDAAKVNLPLMEKNLARHQLKLRTAIGVDRNSRETAKQAQALLASKPKAIVALANNLPLTELIRQTKPQLPGTTWHIISFIDSEKLVADLQQLASGLVLSQVVPVPQKLSQMVVAEFRRLWDKTYPGVPPTPTALEGYVAARTMVAGLQANPDKPLAGLEAVNMDLGSHLVKFGAGRHNGSTYVNLAILRRGGTLLD